MTPPPPSRVLMTADTVGGVWTYAIELAGALAPDGIEVVLATMGEPPSRAQRADAARANVELVESDFRLEWMDEPWDDVRRAGDWLLGLARSRGVDLVHLNGYAHGALPWDVPVLVTAHSCVCSWWRAVRGEPAPPAWDRYRRAVRAGLRAADAVVAPSAAMLGALGREYGAVPHGRVIPNARDPRAFAPASKEPLVLAVGRLWDDAKNVAALAAVARNLPWPVCVAGETRRPGGGDGVDGETGHFEGTRYLGRLAPRDLASWMGRASIYALPARYEPFGLSPVEAALAGCALVLGDLPSLREVWGEAAVYVPPDDRDALRAALQLLCACDEGRERLAAAARERALARYTPARMAASYRAVYADLLQRRASRREAACAS